MHRGQEGKGTAVLEFRMQLQVGKQAEVDAVNNDPPHRADRCNQANKRKEVGADGVGPAPQRADRALERGIVQEHGQAEIQGREADCSALHS